MGSDVSIATTHPVHQATVTPLSHCGGSASKWLDTKKCPQCSKIIIPSPFGADRQQRTCSTCRSVTVCQKCYELYTARHGPSSVSLATGFLRRIQNGKEKRPSTRFVCLACENVSRKKLTRMSLRRLCSDPTLSQVVLAITQFCSSSPLRGTARSQLYFIVCGTVPAAELTSSKVADENSDGDIDVVRGNSPDAVMPDFNAVLEQRTCRRILAQQVVADAHVTSAATVRSSVAFASTARGTKEKSVSVVWSVKTPPAQATRAALQSQSHPNRMAHTAPRACAAQKEYLTVPRSSTAAHPSCASASLSPQPMRKAPLLSSRKASESAMPIRRPTAAAFFRTDSSTISPSFR